jgi:hypothetical protein
MRLIDADAQYERACNLEAQALDYVGKLIERDGDEVSVEWKIWSAILTERTAFKHDVFDAPTIDAVELRDVAKMLCDMFGDFCACNYNGIDEWLPYVCKYEKNGECPSPIDEYGCWMEFLRSKFGGNDEQTD